MMRSDVGRRDESDEEQTSSSIDGSSDLQQDGEAVSEAELAELLSKRRVRYFTRTCAVACSSLSGIIC
jgi:hypothetical protein